MSIVSLLIMMSVAALVATLVSLRGGARGLSAASRFAPSRAAHRRHRRVVLPPVHRAAASWARESSATRLSTSSRSRWTSRAPGRLRRRAGSTWSSSARAVAMMGGAVRVRHALADGHRHPGHLGGPRHGGAHGHRRQPCHRHDVRRGRRDGRRGRACSSASSGVRSSSTRGFIPGIKAFTAAVLGGIGNIPGAMVGGFVPGRGRGARLAPLPGGHRGARAQPAEGRHRVHDPRRGPHVPTPGPPR